MNWETAPQLFQGCRGALVRRFQTAVLRTRPADGRIDREQWQRIEEQWGFDFDGGTEELPAWTYFDEDDARRLADAPGAPIRWRTSTGSHWRHGAERDVRVVEVEGSQYRVHVDIVEPFTEVLRESELLRGGCLTYCPRLLQGSRLRLSPLAFGLGFELVRPEPSLGCEPRDAHRAVAEVAERHGFAWGANQKEPMPGLFWWKGKVTS